MSDLATSSAANSARRARVGRAGSSLFLASLIIALAALLTLLFTIVDRAFGLVAVEYRRPPETLADRPLEALSKEELLAILVPNISNGLYRRLDRDMPFAERTTEDVLTLVYERVVEERVEASFPLWSSLTQRAAIEAQVVEELPNARLQWRAWLNPRFLQTPMSQNPDFAGVRTALMGSVMVILITILFAVPIGVGAAIYLEEYATGERWIERLIQTNINNLAGVPSIIYGMLGLAIFVRALATFTSGSLFGVAGQNGRTVLSAGLTMGLLILPIVIIASQEAIRAVPRSLRLASFGLGATRWQTVRHHVLPSAMPGILTGIILAVSRAIGETAPLIVVGASTYIVRDPTLFSNFTVLPIQIYTWTAQPQAEFRNIAAAAILVLLVLLLSLNATAIFLRNRFRRAG